MSAALVAAAIVVAGNASEGAAVPFRQSFESFPNRIGPSQGAREALLSSILDVLRVTDYVNRLYVRSNGIRCGVRGVLRESAKGPDHPLTAALLARCRLDDHGPSPRDGPAAGPD